MTMRQTENNRKKIRKENSHMNHQERQRGGIENSWDPLGTCEER